MFSLSASKSKLAQNAISEYLFCKDFLGGTPHTLMLCMLSVFHTMPFAMTSFIGLVHYYNMTEASKILSTGIAIVYLHKDLQFEHWHGLIYI